MTRELPIVIAHAGDLSRPSGGSNRVTAFASGLAEAGYPVTVVVPTPDSVLPDRLADVDIETVAVETGSVLNQPIRAVRICRRAKRIATQQGARLQFEHSTLGGVGSLLGANEYVLDMHDLAFPSPLYTEQPFGELLSKGVRAIETRAVRNANKIIVVSEQMRRFVREEWALPRSRFEIIPNGYFPEIVHTDEGAADEVTRVSFLGTLHPKLNVDAFFEIARIDDVDEVAIIGDGAKRDELKDQKRRLGQENVRLYGHLSNDRAFGLLESSTLAVNPQHYSRLQAASSPVKLYYYAALGLPAVVSAGPDIATELAEGDAAAIVGPDEKFAERVERLLDDESQRKRMRARAHELAESWTWDRRTNELVDLYEQDGVDRIERGGV